MTWLNDHTSDVFVIATCNDITKLPPEFSRAERFDGCFFLDLPDEAERRAIWQSVSCITSRSIPRNDCRPTPAGPAPRFAPAADLAALLDLPLAAAAENIVPVARTAAESVERLRTWAGGRCLDASRAGLYRGPAGAPTEDRRVAFVAIPPTTKEPRFDANAG